MTLPDVDFAERYRADYRRANRPERAPEYWDRRAGAMSEEVFLSGYARAFLARMALTGCATLLDVGCGPGTIGLSVASRLRHVYGLDHSPGMLAAFRAQAQARGLANVTPIQRAWDDDWSDVPVCDVVVASRATAVRGFEAAAVKLVSKAARRVYLTYPAHGNFVGDEICRALGRQRDPLPDYLHVVGILHHLGMHPRLDFVPDANRFNGCVEADDFVAKARDLVGDLTDAEVALLRGYVREHGPRLRQASMRWAFISWDVSASA